MTFEFDFFSTQEELQACKIATNLYSAIAIWSKIPFVTSRHIVPILKILINYLIVFQFAFSFDFHILVEDHRGFSPDSILNQNFWSFH